MGKEMASNESFNYYKVMRNERASICMWDLDAEEERHILVDGIGDERLQKNPPHTLATENNECRDQTKAWHQKECDATDYGEERILKLYGHICRMDDNRLLKNVVFGIIDGLNRRGRPRREWVDDIKEWCRTDAQNSASSHRTVRSGDKLSWRHWTATGASPWNAEAEFQPIKSQLFNCCQIC